MIVFSSYYHHSFYSSSTSLSPSTKHQNGQWLLSNKQEKKANGHKLFAIIIMLFFILALREKNWRYISWFNVSKLCFEFSFSNGVKHWNKKKCGRKKLRVFFSMINHHLYFILIHQWWCLMKQKMRRNLCMKKMNWISILTSKQIYFSFFLHILHFYKTKKEKKNIHFKFNDKMKKNASSFNDLWLDLWFHPG